MTDASGLALRNFTRNRRRYRLLLVSMTTVVAVLLVLIGFSEGVQQAIRQKAVRYFAGDLTVHSFRGRGFGVLKHEQELSRLVHELAAQRGFPSAQIVERSVYTAQDSTLFFPGGYMSQRRLVGVDWEQERKILSSMGFVEGGLPAPGSQQLSALISTVVAQRVGARVGDEIILSLTTERGRRNTVALVVAGIYEEYSFFGYTTYLDRTTLNRTRELPDRALTEIGLHLSAPEDLTAPAVVLHAELDRLLETSPELFPEYELFPIWNTRAERDQTLREHRSDGRALGVMTLDAHLDQISNLLDALTLVAAVAVAAFLVIVMVGVSNTYVMITYERTREIGTLRALGLTRFGTLQLFLTEAAIMGFAAGLLGLPLGIGLLYLLKMSIDLQGNVWAALILVEGRLLWHLPAIWPPLVMLSVAVAAVLGSLQPARRAAFRLQPADALRRN